MTLESDLAPIFQSGHALLDTQMLLLVFYFKRERERITSQFFTVTQLISQFTKEQVT